MKSLADILRLWYHESCRVFQDRLVNDEDRLWFQGLLQEKMKADFNTEVEEVITSEPLLYGDFMSPSVDSRIYAEITDHQKVYTSLVLGRIVLCHSHMERHNI